MSSPRGKPGLQAEQSNEQSCQCGSCTMRAGSRTCFIIVAAACMQQDLLHRRHDRQCASRRTRFIVVAAVCIQQDLLHTFAVISTRASAAGRRNPAKSGTQSSCRQPTHRLEAVRHIAVTHSLCLTISAILYALTWLGRWSASPSAITACRKAMVSACSTQHSTAHLTKSFISQGHRVTRQPRLQTR